MGEGGEGEGNRGEEEVMGEEEVTEGNRRWRGEVTEGRRRWPRAGGDRGEQAINFKIVWRECQ